ncbi:MAG TPA: hypothetical protein DDX47_06110 [Candidatus Jacksonbacteria bacterium]|nr:MAG: hypothetical protein UW45_C0008G0046 [Parcubacteria group bacterium GW2011_GWC2_44_22]HBH46904.1 hypothetical protein [Candidatus Jacksonbacteria bacterium]HCR15521.1 hypothetical protein [Candidatus Jacksonbacteria bacterium]
MLNKKYKLVLISLITAAGLLKTGVVQAVCPVCTIAVGAGVGLAQWLGIDDTVTGVWVGGLTVSMIFWTINFLAGKKINWWRRDFIIALVYYLMIVIPLSYSGLIGHPQNTLVGVDKLLLGAIFGSLGFFLGVRAYEVVKRKNHDRAYFPFQKVAMPVAPLIILSFIFYLITK